MKMNEFDGLLDDLNFDETKIKKKLKKLIIN